MRELPGTPLSSPTHPYQSVHVLCMLAAVGLLSTFAPVMKFVFQHSDISPLSLACIRVMIGFIFLLTVTLCRDRRDLLYLGRADIWGLTLLGFLGVGLSYAIAAWGLLHTSVAHYVLIYSLTPSFTAAFSFLTGKDRASAVKVAGILLSCLGGAIVVSDGFHDSLLSLGIGDALVLLFAMMLSAQIVLSSTMVKRYGALTANTVMFGSSSLLLLAGAIVWTELPREPLSLTTFSLIVFIGSATAAVFLLRFTSLRSLTPATVGGFHNLVPVFTLLFAYVFLGEAPALHSIIGGVAILAGVELVRRT